MEGVIPRTATAPPVASAWTRLRSFFYEELKPQPGRLKGALLRVAGTLLALWVGLGLDLPEMGAVLCLAFFGSTRNRAEGKKVVLGAPPVVLAIVGLVTIFLNLFGATPLVRTIAFLVIIFSSLYMIQAARIGAIFLMGGIFGKLFLTLWDNGLPAELIQELQLWIVADLTVAGCCAAFIFSVFGDPEKDPVAEFRNALASQFDRVARFLADPAESSEADNDKLQAEALCARETLLPLLETAKKKNKSIKSREQDLIALTRMSTLLLHESVVLTTYSLEEKLRLRPILRWAGDRCHAIARTVQSGIPLTVSENRPDVPNEALSGTVVSTVEMAEGILDRRTAPPIDYEQEHSKGFLRADVATNPIYLNNALRSTAAAFSCYFLLAASDWDGIGTSVTTCLITAMTTRAQSRQKQALRFGGALIGGLLGLIVMIYILPKGTDLTGLSIVTAIITFLGAWIYEGGPRLSYAGVQLVICFFLGVFGENKTPMSLISMRDRVLGILIGNLAMWLFYDGIEPAWSADRLRVPVARALNALGKFAGLRNQSGHSREAAYCRLIEKKAFLDASSELKEMSDVSGPELGHAGEVRRRLAPQMVCVESSMRQLFSFEFVASESSLLRLPAVPANPSSQRVADSLVSLASRVEGGYQIQDREPPIKERAADQEELLVSRVGAEMARLFPA